MKPYCDDCYDSVGLRDDCCDAQVLLRATVMLGMIKFHVVDPERSDWDWLSLNSIGLIDFPNHHSLSCVVEIYGVNFSTDEIFGVFVVLKKK